MVIASLVLGIVGVVFSFIGLYLPAAIIGVVGIILGALGRKRTPEKKGMATAGLVLSIIAVALALITYIACMACVSAANSAINSLA